MLTHPPFPGRLRGPGDPCGVVVGVRARRGAREMPKGARRVKRTALAAAAVGLATAASMSVFVPPANAAPPGASKDNSSAQVRAAADPASLAAAVADKAVSSGLDKLAKGPDEAYSRVS